MTVIDYQNPSTIDLVLDSADMGGTPNVRREIIVIGDPTTSANLTSVDSGGHVLVQTDPTTAVAQALTPVYFNSTAAAVIKASAGSLFGAWILNLATTTVTTTNLVMFVHFFNTNTTVGLTTTSWLFALPLPSPGAVNTVAAGANAVTLRPGPYAHANFSNGIVIVVNTTSTSNATAAGTAPVGVLWIL